MTPAQLAEKIGCTEDYVIESINLLNEFEMTYCTGDGSDDNRRITKKKELIKDPVEVEHEGQTYYWGLPV